MRPTLEVEGLAELRRVTTGDPGVVVAVLDGPVDISHPCFQGARLRQVPTLVHQDAGPGRMSRHGTHVASILFGQPETSVAGLAPRCTGLVAPVFQDYQEGRLPQLDLARAIEQAVADGAAVINISGGQRSDTGQPDPLLGRALQTCADNGVLVVAAAGNDGCECLHVPAAVDGVLAVGALGRDGRALRSSNWHSAYLGHGVMAPGDAIPGALPGGGVATMSGTSFATPIVAGVVALLLSEQRRSGSTVDARHVAEALLRTAKRGGDPGDAASGRYLDGVLNITRVRAYLSHQGRTSMTQLGQASQEALHDSTSPAPDGVAAASEPPGPSQAPATPEAAGGPQPGAAVSASATSLFPPGVYPPGLAMTNGFLPPWVAPGYPFGPYVQPAPALAAVGGAPSVVASAENSNGGGPPSGCGCKPRNTGPTVCDCVPVRTSYVYALGEIGFDFGTEARRDSFRQLMPDVERQVGNDPPILVSPNPYDVFQLVDYLERRPSESTKLIWTLNLDLTPIYAIEAEPGYPEDVYATLREALRSQALPKDDPAFVSRVSIPGTLTNRTVQLFSGQVVPVVVAQPRGLYRWDETRLIQSVVDVLTDTPDLDDFDEDYVRRVIRTFLDKVYYECRNLGQTSADRALNFAATNAYQVASGVAEGFLSGQVLVPGERGNLYTLDRIDVERSPYGRVDSDGWDVRVTFFDPENDRRARTVIQFTIDVSDILPVTLAPAHRYLTT